MNFPYYSLTLIKETLFFFFDCNRLSNHGFPSTWYSLHKLNLEKNKHTLNKKSDHEVSQRDYIIILHGGILDHIQSHELMFKPV